MVRSSRSVVELDPPWRQRDGRRGRLARTLEDPDVEAVLSVGRRPCGVTHPKLRELLLDDLFGIAAAEPQLAG